MVEGCEVKSATNSSTRVRLDTKTDGHKTCGPKITANFGIGFGIDFGTDFGPNFGTGTDFGPNFGTGFG